MNSERGPPMAEVDRSSLSATTGQDQLAHGSILGEEGGTDAKLLDR
jgi:hypothetical protein